MTYHLVQENKSNNQPQWTGKNKKPQKKKSNNQPQWNEKKVS